MKKFVSSLLLIFTPALLFAEPAEITTADQLLEAFADAVHEQVGGQLQDLSQGPFIQALDDLAGEMLNPRKDLLHQQAADDLAAMPVFPGSIDDLKPAFVEERQGLDYIIAKDSPIYQTPMKNLMILSMWNPETAANRVMELALSRSVPPPVFAKYALMWKTAPPPVYTLDKNPDAPSLVLRVGDVWMRVDMTYEAGGYYRARNIRFYKAS